ncbi:2Fe-2S iron-sulfur cluster-binding protein [Streptomyces bobili]|uniref:2Fe-2S iron-sulfur cluster-binding protein n=1 Tax=Streptomyces bobili TaxID=67280 RepID=UPI003424357D
MERSMSINPLAHLFDGVSDVIAEIERRGETGADQPVDARAEIMSLHPEGIDLVVAQVIEETASTRTFRMRRPGGGELPPFLAGQYISLNVRIGDVLTNRPFSISSSPAVRDSYDLTVRRLKGGRVSNHLIDTVTVGHRFTSGGPVGAFSHNPLFHGDDVVFLAGGSGVAPAMSMIRDIVDRGLSRRMTLVYGSRRAEDVIFRDELDGITDRQPNIRVHHVISQPGRGWKGAAGPLDAGLITSLLGPLAGRMTYLCGPSSKYDFLVKELESLGHPRRRIRVEAGNVAKPPPTDPRWPTVLDPRGEVTVTVRGRKSVSIPRGQALLEGLEDNGLRPKASCRSGECSMCRVRICSGEVYHAEEARLRMSDRQFGFAHSCVAYPLTDLEIDF